MTALIYIGALAPVAKIKPILWGIPSSDGIPYGLADFFFFFSPSAAENGISGGQTHGRKPWIDLIF